MSQYLMAVDAGTGSVRAVIFDTEGRQIECIQKEWEHPCDPRFPGSMDFDWEKNWELARYCIEAAVKSSGVDPADIAAVSTTCMREGILLYDGSGTEIWACANVDARSVDEVKYLLDNYPGLETSLYLKTGQSFALDALPRLLWVKNNLPEIYEKTHHIGMFNDWLIYKLTGKLAVEPSNGSTTGLMELKTRSWDSCIAESAGLRSDIFPPVAESGEIAGYVSREGAAQTGLKEGTAVVTGGGDAQLGCIGVGVVDDGDAAIFGGSFWQYEYNTASPQTDEKCRVRVNCHAIKNMWQYEALAFKPGLLMRWFRDAFCIHEKFLASESGADVYELMNEKVSKVPAGCHGMLCTFSDIMNFISWKHASPTFTNFDFEPDKYNIYTFYRAILENTAFITRGHMLLVKETTGKYPDSVIFASGASKSILWSQILADVLGIKVKVPAVKEATALGAAILAGYGVGIYSDISKTSKSLVEIENEFIPNEKNHKLYCEIYDRWRKLYAAQLEIADRGLTRHMWKAPGI